MQSENTAFFNNNSAGLRMHLEQFLWYNKELLYLCIEVTQFSVEYNVSCMINFCFVINHSNASAFRGPVYMVPNRI